MINIPKIPFIRPGPRPEKEVKTDRQANLRSSSATLTEQPNVMSGPGRQVSWRTSSTTLTEQPNVMPGRAANERKNFFLNHMGLGTPVAEDPLLAKLRQSQIDAVTALLAGPKRNRLSLKANDDLDRLKQQMGPATKKNINKFRKKLIGILAANMQPEMSEAAARKRAAGLFKQAMVDHHNGKPWKPIHCSFFHDDHMYNSRLTPAGQIKHNGRNIFKNDYHDKGVSSGTSTCIDHATNLWISEFSASRPGEWFTEIPLFKGVRHGTLSPYGVKPGKERDEGALTRAREVATAALFLQQEKFKAALSGEEVELKLSSTSLLTAVNIAGQTEGKQLADQLNAWNKLCDENPAILEIRDGDGPPKKVKVRLQVAAFNFGVNEAALNLKLGWSDSDRQNEIGLKQLLGDELQPGGVEGGWVAAYLNQDPPPPPRNAKIVAILSEQIREIWDKKMHHKDGGEPYKLAERIALLSHLIDVVPCYNCKSGKDRTGMLDSELKRELVQLNRHGKPTELRKHLDSDQQAVFRKVLAKGGNLEIQEMNTGVPGNKVLKKLSKWGNNLSFRVRIGDKGSFKEARGASGAVST